MGERAEKVVRDFIELRNTGDIERTVAALHPEVEWDMSRSRSPYQGLYRGREETARLLEDVTDAWGKVEWQTSDLTEIDEATLVVQTRLHGRGKGSGIEVSGEGAGVFTLRDGRIARFVLCQSLDEALELAREST